MPKKMTSKKVSKYRQSIADTYNLMIQEGSKHFSIEQIFQNPDDPDKKHERNVPTVSTGGGATAL